ncbi:inhibitor of nuclear factor kappa-B kinase subunit alpha-like isoform X2 [Vespa crabro]|uniref:inhibitor of nuclear factor kappa-B kinase subunit alpha-like isoform X2 n=1 Tax=Vespa crabro TaxID=7445 RepID=UPI001F01004C|nr:inhibitor of nuclear factor kappa-B kinase subunit alpha-like isoform X2 [Vespa crabro]
MTTVTSLNWNCERILGTGGFGIVKLWVHKSTGQKLVKQCKWNDTQLTAIQKERWTREVEIMKRLTHPNIVKAIHIPFELLDKDKSMPVLCMEYCTMGDLRKVLNKPENCCGIKETDTLKIISNILLAVKYLHLHNITHRDLKPENVVLQPVKGTVLYKLIDLGYAKEIGETSTSASIVGTLNYVAPELLCNEKYSCSVDYWSLGILFYEIITGKRPFLPLMPHTIEWMQIIKNKSNDDICAYECEGKVIFRQDIEDPIDLSSYIRSAMVEWFKVVLQWDPKKRGKQLDVNGTFELVVFKLLEPALLQKVLYVYCMYLYKINTYVIDNNTTLSNLQFLIEKDTNISVNHQILTDYYGNILLNDTPVLAQINNSMLFVLKTGDILIYNIPVLSMPYLTQKMIEQSKSELGFEALNDYYRATIFMMKQELHFFNLYIFALSIEVDLINARLVKFGKCMKNTLQSTNLLAAEVTSCQTHYVNQEIKKEKIEALEENSKKVNKLLTAANQIQLQFTSLNEDNNVLRNIAQNISIEVLYEIYDKALDIYKTFKETFNRIGTPTKMVKVLFEFIKLREVQFRENKIIEFARQINKLENELFKLEGSFDSVIVMTKKYQEDLHSIIKEDSDMELSSKIDEITEPNKSIECHDSLIYENLIVRHTMDNLMTEIEKIYQEIGLIHKMKNKF